MDENKKKILIVEDESAMLRILRDELERENFISISATDGAEGLQKALQLKPDLILLDILLPKVNGLVMLTKLRESGDYGKKVPVILLTNLNPDSEEINKIITETSPTYYLIKSDWSTADVVDKIKEQLSQSH